MENNKWIDVLRLSKIDEKYYEKVSKHLDKIEVLFELEFDKPIENERLYKQKLGDKISKEILILEKIVNLENVQFIEAPMCEIDEKVIQVGTFSQSVAINNDDVKNLISKLGVNVENLSIEALSFEISKIINDAINENKKVYIFKLFDRFDIISNVNHTENNLNCDSKLIVYSRFAIV